MQFRSFCLERGPEASNKDWGKLFALSILILCPTGNPVGKPLHFQHLNKCDEPGD